MSLAIIADIHGNLPALEAVIADIAGLGVGEVIVNGDMVGRGPMGTAVVERIAGLGWACVGGNHEEYLLDFVHRRVPASWWTLEEWASSRWMAAELSDAAVAFIEDLPFSMRKGELHIVHGTLESNRVGFGTWTDDATLEAQLDRCGARALVCAHTHRAMIRRLGPRKVVNVGSVGLPFNGDTRAQYAVFRGDDVELRQVAYDQQPLLDAYRDTGFLAEGGVSAALLDLELRNARPFLVPFLKWCSVQSLEPVSERVDAFLAWHQPFAPLALLYDKLLELAPDMP
jgi:predicted phosphodiesterase